MTRTLRRASLLAVLLTACGGSEDLELSVEEMTDGRDAFGSGEVSGFLVCTNQANISMRCPTEGWTALYTTPSHFSSRAVDLSSYQIVWGSCSKISEFRDRNYSGELMARNYYCRVTLVPLRPKRALPSLTEQAYYILGRITNDTGTSYPYVKLSGTRFTTRTHDSESATIFMGDPDLGEAVGEIKSDLAFTYDASESLLKDYVAKDGTTAVLEFFRLLPGP